MFNNTTITSRELKRISLIISFIGIIILSYSAKTYSPKQTDIKDIDESIQGQYILVCGTVKGQREAGKNTFMQIEDNYRSIDVVFFKRISNIKDNDDICIKGIVEIYKGKIEILGKSIA
ncbi:MAG: OB-fold nucleic acid binding domain-containing protein [archaeon]|nr:OB-fold nucleic acid binding domain-containing protein [archaeon]